MKMRSVLFVVLLTVTLFAVAGFQEGVDAGQELPLQESITGIWKFPVDGYYIGFDEEGWMCSGGSEESVAGKRYCSRYTLEDDVVTETCMGGPEDRNCPLGGGSCKARVSVGDNGQLTYRILHE